MKKNSAFLIKSLEKEARSLLHLKFPLVTTIVNIGQGFTRCQNLVAASSSSSSSSNNNNNNISSRKVPEENLKVIKDNSSSLREGGFFTFRRKKERLGKRGNTTRCMACAYMLHDMYIHVAWHVHTCYMACTYLLHGMYINAAWLQTNGCTVFISYF